MKSRSTKPRVLLTTAYRRFNNDYLDIVSMMVTKFPRPTAPLRISTGLRFIKQNVPEVEILEYPLWDEYVAKLKEGWDVVGFSTFHSQIEQIQKMVKEARNSGVKEIWAGNYGVFADEIRSIVDRVFIGTAEDEIAQIFGYRVPQNEIKHPVMMVRFSILPSIPYFSFGLLYTAHGCPFKCTFCQSQIFEPNHFAINYDSVEKVVAYYYKRGITDIIILDELFGLIPKHTDKITRLLAKYKMRWLAESRASFFLQNLDIWYERGLRFPVIGAEAMSQASLDSVNKGQKIEEILEFSRRTAEKKDMFRIVTYMIGYPQMNSDQMIEDALKLKKVGFDVNGLTVLTPYPKTPLWNEIKNKYGIIDCDYDHYDSRHLVWNHPHVSPLEMNHLVKNLKVFLNKPIDFYKNGVRRFIKEEIKDKKAHFFWNSLIKNPVNSMLIDDRKQVFY